MKLIYPGSFDPITYGHLDIIKRTAAFADKIYIAVLVNSSKVPMFSAEERVSMIEKCLQKLSNVEVITFNGLLVDLFKHYDIDAIIKGLRAISDFEYEFQMAQINREMNVRAETLFMMTAPQYGYLSSSLVREIHRFGGDIHEFVPGVVEEAMHKKTEENQ